MGSQSTSRRVGLFALFWSLVAWAAIGIALGASTERTTILILGDSLTEGYGVALEKAFPALLEAKLAESGKPFKVVNGGSSGATSASGLRRLQWYARTQPDYVIFALGSNDGLRGVPVAETRKNLDAMIRKAKEEGRQVLLAGLQLPPNYGPEYTAAFEQMTPELAEQHELPYMDFLLEGVAGEADKNLVDGIHPNEAGHEIIAENMLRFLRRTVPELKASTEVPQSADRKEP